MFITLPLMLIGIGFMIYFLFVAATYVLPLYAGLAAGFAALHAGMPYPDALLLGVTASLLMVFISHAAIHLTPKRHLRIAIALPFAVPASIVGFRVASALLQLGSVGRDGTVFALAAALATGVVAAKRYEIRPRG